MLETMSVRGFLALAKNQRVTLYLSNAMWQDRGDKMNSEAEASVARGGQSRLAGAAVGERVLAGRRLHQVVGIVCGDDYNTVNAQAQTLRKPQLVAGSASAGGLGGDFAHDAGIQSGRALRRREDAPAAGAGMPSRWSRWGRTFCCWMPPTTRLPAKPASSCAWTKASGVGACGGRRGFPPLPSASPSRWPRNVRVPARRPLGSPKPRARSPGILPAIRQARRNKNHL